MRKAVITEKDKIWHNKILAKLQKQQNRLRILDSDFVALFAMSQSYYSMIKLKPYYISYAALERLEFATKFLDDLFKKEPKYNMGQQLAETITDYRKRKKKEIYELFKQFAVYIENNGNYDD